MTWQPIETAPKDGKRVLVYAWQDGVSLLGVGFWVQPRTLAELGGWICRTLPEQDVDGTFSDPTHWMPLPAPPPPAPSVLMAFCDCDQTHQVDPGYHASDCIYRTLSQAEKG